MCTTPNTEQPENRSNNTHQVQGDEHTPPNSVSNVSSIDFEHDYCVVYTDNSPVRNGTYYTQIV